AEATAAGPILAIDLGKYKSVASVYDRQAAAADFRTIDTSTAEVERLIRRTPPAVVVIEACALTGWVHDLCAILGVRCRVADTAAEVWKYKHARRKTDRDDPLRVAQLDTLGQPPRWWSRPGRSGSRRTGSPTRPGRAGFGRAVGGSLNVGATD